MLHLHALVDLAARRGADVVPLARELAQVSQGVGAGGHGLRFQRLDLVVLRRSHLARHHTAQVILDRQLVDQVEHAAVVQIDQDAAAVALALDTRADAADRRDREPAAGMGRHEGPLGDPQRRIGDARSRAHHEGAGHPDAPQAAQVPLGRLAGRIVADAHPVKVDVSVEARLPGFAGLPLQPLGELLGLPFVTQRRHLQPVEALLGRGCGRLDPQRPVDGDLLPFDGGGQRLLTAGDRQRFEIARQPHLDEQRLDRSGRKGLRVLPGLRPRRGRFRLRRRRLGLRSRRRSGHPRRGGRQTAAGTADRQDQGQQDQEKLALHATSSSNGRGPLIASRRRGPCARAGSPRQPSARRAGPFRKGG